MLQLIIHLTVQSRDAPEGKCNGTPKNSTSDLDKNVRRGGGGGGGAFEVVLKCAREAAFELHLYKMFHLNVDLMLH